jgi:hypothetical protein
MCKLLCFVTLPQHSPCCVHFKLYINIHSQRHSNLLADTQALLQNWDRDVLSTWKFPHAYPWPNEQSSVTDDVLSARPPVEQICRYKQHGTTKEGKKIRVDANER